MKAIEGIQKKAAGIVKGRKIEGYHQAMAELKWTHLHHRRQYHRNIMCYKVCNGLVDLEFDEYFKERHCERNIGGVHDMQLVPKYARTNICKYSFFYEVIEQWNQLPTNIVEQYTLDGFKSHLTNFYSARSHSEPNCNVCMLC